MKMISYILKLKRYILNRMDELITDIDGEKGPDFPLHIECIGRRIKNIRSAIN